MLQISTILSTEIRLTFCEYKGVYELAMEEVKDLKKLYNDWNNRKISFESFDKHIEITTPFVDIHHDYIQLFFIKKSDGRYSLTDDGYTVNELEMMGIEIRTSSKRREFFNTTLKIFGVDFNDATSELYITFKNITAYPEKQHQLIQCMLRISDMLLTSRNTVISIFTEEIAKFFEQNEILYVQDSGYIGVSGNSQNFDFVLPHFKKRNEKFIKAINTPKSDNFVEPLFSWIDVKSTRQNVDFIVLANDSEKPVPDKFIRPIENYSGMVLSWSKKNEWINSLKTS